MMAENSWLELPYIYEENIKKARTLYERILRSIYAKIAGLTRAYMRRISARQRRLLMRYDRETRMRLIRRSGRTGRLFGMFISREAQRLAREITREETILHGLRRAYERIPKTLTIRSTLRFLYRLRVAAEDALEVFERLGRRRTAETIKTVISEIDDLIREKKELVKPKIMYRLSYAINYVYHREYFSVIGQAWHRDKKVLEEIQDRLEEAVKRWVEYMIGYSVGYDESLMPYFEGYLFKPYPPEMFPPSWRTKRGVKVPFCWYDAKEFTEVKYDENLHNRYEIRFEILREGYSEMLEEGRLDEL